MDRLRAWWWILRHPFKSAAIRRHARQRAYGERLRQAEREQMRWERRRTP